MTKPKTKTKAADLGHIHPDLHALARPLSTLHEDPKNARLHNDRNLAAIEASLVKFKQRKPIVVHEDGTVIAGNGTFRVAQKLGWKHIAVVRVDDSPAMAAAFGLVDNRSAELATWDTDQLTETLVWLDDEPTFDFEIGDLGFSMDELDDLVTDADATAPPEYTRKIEPPVYEPKGEKPALDTLVDRTKTESLVEAIDRAEIPEDIRAFLRLAAGRHNVFHYERIAEFYAHAPQDIQALMEQSALVIIDFKQAIENGFVQLTDHLSEAYRDGEA
jgi:hypothetical protein